MKYKEAIEYIESLSPVLEHPTVVRMVEFMKAHGQPQNNLRVLHVGGTNGKGSTVAMLDSILRAGGLKVARYTGPHLLRWNERFHIDGKAIGDSEFARRASDLRELSDQFARANPELGALTWFEFLTALAFFYFVDSKVDVAVIEVGLGGLFDATNVVDKPLVTGITNVALDHTHILGDTVEKIATEKAGIIKAGVPIVTGARTPALEVIRMRANELNAPLVECGDIDRGSFGSELLASVEDCLCGPYQNLNAVVAMDMLKSAGFLDSEILSEAEDAIASSSISKRISLAALRYGLKNVYWPGRFQIIPDLGLILDGAHNVAGAEALRSSLDKFCPSGTRHFVFGCFRNKNGDDILRTLVSANDKLYVSEADSRRATYSKDDLVHHAEQSGIDVVAFDSIGEALKQALEARKESEYIIAAGSFACIREVFNALGWTRVEDGLANLHSSKVNIRP